MQIDLPGSAQSDMVAIDALIQRERAARDTHRWEEMAACWHTDSHVEVSWFRGSGSEFVAASRRMAELVLGIHQMSPSVVSLCGDRAIAETGCCMHGTTALDGVEVVMTTHTRLLWRVVRIENGAWLLAGLRAYYIFDALQPARPDMQLAIDGALLDQLRTPYRWIAYSNARAGRHVPQDLPGIDRPEVIAAMQCDERDWLVDGVTTPAAA